MTAPPAAGRRRLSLRTRLLAALLATTLLVLALFDIVVIRLMHGYLQDRLDNNLRLVELAVTRRPDLAQFASSGSGALQRVGYTVKVVNSRGIWTNDPGSGPELSDTGVRDPARLAASGDAVTGTGALAGTRYVVAAISGQPGEFVLVSATTAELDRTVQRMQRLLLIGTAGAFGVVAVGGWLITRRGLRPLERISQTADGISGGDLSARVEVTDATSEVGRLGTAINAMLGRIESNVDQRERDHVRMRAFMTDASHELRTPLTTVRAYSELYGQGALRESGAVDEAMGRIASESRRMSELVDQLLVLARLDEYPTARTELVDLAALARDAVLDVRGLDPARGWQLDVGLDPVVVSGSGDELRRLVDNVLTNVRRHTPAEAPASVRVRADGADAVLTVSDAGPGVPSDDLPRLFDRFYRPSGTPATGSGLGLSIVAAIAARHGGRVSAAQGLDQAPGLTVSVRLPMCAGL